MLNISMIIPAYNSQATLSLCIKSVISLLKKCDELIILDDGSTDSTLDIATKLASKHTNIRVLSQQNSGVASSLNTLIRVSKNPLIFRMDSDDISLPWRIHLQRKQFQDDKYLAVCGTCAIGFGTRQPFVRPMIVPTHNTSIHLALARGKNPFIHPTVAFNRTLLKDKLYYLESFPHAEDFELWHRLSSQNFKMKNILLPSLLYNIHSESVSLKYKQKQVNSAQLINDYYTQ